jgi:large conductance mechanosensitive channel
MLKGFRDFILRGNVVELAVAVILGAAFGAIVSSFVGDILNPLLAAIVSKPDFSYLILEVHGGKIQYG